MNKRKCRHCKEYFKPTEGIIVPLGFFCSYGHLTAHSIPKGRVVNAKHEKKKHAKRLADLKPIKYYEDKAQHAINAYVRARDAHRGCVSCDKPNTWDGQWHCSHYFSKGHSSSLRYNLWNMHKSCSICNNHLSGNIGDYKPELINRIGKEKLDWMISVKANPTRYTREYLQRLQRIFNKKTRKLKQRLNEKRAAA